MIQIMVKSLLHYFQIRPFILSVTNCVHVKPEKYPDDISGCRERTGNNNSKITFAEKNNIGRYTMRSDNNLKYRCDTMQGNYVCGQISELVRFFETDDEPTIQMHENKESGNKPEQNLYVPDRNEPKEGRGSNGRLINGNDISGKSKKQVYGRC